MDASVFLWLGGTQRAMADGGACFWQHTLSSFSSEPIVQVILS